MRTPPPPRRARLRRALTVQNFLATLAVVASLSGTAYAALVVTGRNVRDSTLTSADFRNLTLGTHDISAAGAAALRVKGPTGWNGPAGEQGLPGLKGPTGDRGRPAPKAFTFQKATQSTRIMGHKPNPAPSEVPNCTDPADLVVNCNGTYMADASGTLKFPRWNYKCLFPHCNVSNVSVDRMNSQFYNVMLTSQNASGGFLDMPYAGTVLLNATATFYTQATDSQQRLQCQLQLSRVENGLAQAPVAVGAPITVYRHLEGDSTSVGSRNRQERLLNIHVTGAVAQPAGVFETMLGCRSLDDSGTPNDRLEFIEGNMSVLSTRTNGQA